MSLDKCIPDLVREGKMSREQGERALAIHGRRRLHHERSMGRDAATAMADEDTATAMEREFAQKKRQTLLQVSAQKRLLIDQAAYDGGSGKHPGAAALALFDHDGRAPYMNVEGQRKAIVGRAHAMMTDILFKHSRNIRGQVRKPAELRDLVRAAFGERVDNENAVELADAWGQTGDMLRQRFNAAGGAIGKLERWGLPQSHDAMKVRMAGGPDATVGEAFDAWLGETLPRLDRERMIDQSTGQPFDEPTLKAVLRDVFETIRSEGTNKLAPGGVGGSKLANQRAEHRFLVFRSADDWMAYAERFGTADPFDVMMGHISGMSRDIAHMEVLGPNPAATVRWLQDGLTKGAGVDEAPATKGLTSAKYHAGRIGQLYDTTSGALSSPVSPRVAYTFGTIRQLLVAAKLGGAALSSLSDVGFQAVTRAFNRLPIAGALTGYLKLLNPAAGGDRRTAVRLGLIAQEAANMASSQNRYLGEAVSGEIASRLAEGVLRASGLSAWTQAGRWAFGMELLGHLADQLADSGSHAFGKLDGGFRRLLERYGIDEASWDQLRATPLYEHRGSKFLRPMDVADQALGDRLLRMVHTETAYAVPEATVRARSLLTFGPPGSIAGELSRNVGLFKSFGVSMLLTHGRRIIEQQPHNAAIYAAALFGTTTLLGAGIMALKEITKGRDPRPMTGLDAKEAAQFWGAAALQGGGLSIFGDFLGSAMSDRLSGTLGGGLGEALAGPVTSFGSDFVYDPLSMATAAAMGKDPHVGRKMIKLAKGYTPGSSLWYGRLALERIAADQLQQQIDPGHAQSWMLMHRRAAQQGQGYWWAPGETEPDRAPEVR